MNFDDWHYVMTGIANSDTWQSGRTGIYRFGKNDIAIFATPTPVFPTTIYSNIDTKEEKIKLEYWNHTEPAEVIVPRDWLATQSGCTKLSKYGIDVNANNYKAFIAYVSNVAQDLPSKKSRSVLGWAKDGFIPFSSEVEFDGSIDYRQLYESIRAEGDLDEWAAFLKPFRERLALRLCMAASFASPLIAIVGENPFVFHLWGGTSAGKTVALMVAASIWGNPSNGKLTRTLNMTKNAMLSTAAFLNNIPFFGDELQTIKSSFNNSYDAIIMQVAEGIDRSRMNNDRLNETKSWKNSFLFTGEEPCVHEDSGGGVVNRVIEVECTEAVVDKDDGNKVANFVRENYGLAAEPFVRSIEKQAVRNRYNEIKKALMQSDTTSKQAGAMALILLGDEIASGLFWPDEKRLEISDVECFMKSAADVDVTERAFEFVRRLIVENSVNFQQDASRITWGRIDAAEHIVYFIGNKLDALMNENRFSLKACIKKWIKNGHIKKPEIGNTVVKKINGESIRCYQIILEDDIEPLPDEVTVPF